MDTDDVDPPSDLSATCLAAPEKPSHAHVRAFL
jgi:hypothetical protein